MQRGHTPLHFNKPPAPGGWLKGSVKEAAGKVLGDKKLETDGTTEKAAGKVQNAIGGLKDAVRGK